MPKSRFAAIQDPDNFAPTQLSLIPTPGHQPYAIDPYPPILKSEAEAIACINDCNGLLGVDWEFNPATMKPTILGVANMGRAVAIPWSKMVAAHIVERAEAGVKLVAHSGLGTRSDKAIIEYDLKITTPLTYWVDTMIQFYLCHQDFAKSSDKEDDDSGSIGLMNLWSMAAFHTQRPQWKWCRGLACVGPCPHHKVYGYCAVDAWAGLAGHVDMNKWMADRKIPWTLYDHTAAVTELCGKMESKGVCIDRKQVKVLENLNTDRKSKLFPFEMVGKKKVYTGPFNPQSSDQILNYFQQHNIHLEGTDKKLILAELKVKAKEKKWLLKEMSVEGTGKDHYIVRGGDEIIEDAEMGEALSALYHLFQYKNAGKGGKAWFDDKYFDNHNRIHPRFIPTGASSGRLASSRPNFQNIPRIGWGVEVRKAIVPSSSDFCITKADYSQLELRVCLWYAGITMPPGTDFFSQLVAHKPDVFQHALDISAFTKVRDISKSVVHACDYGEGFMALTTEELGTERRRKERQVGALLVFDGFGDLPRWEYAGRIVCFTGANLAERLFGQKTYEYRKAALDLQQVYMQFVPGIRDWHMSITQEIDQYSAVRSAFGSYLELYGTADENFKMGTAFKGQGGGAHLAQEKMLLCPDIPILNVHDEFVIELPSAWGDKQIRDYYRFMEGPSTKLPGLSCPVNVSRGINWGSCTAISD